MAPNALFSRRPSSAAPSSNVSARSSFSIDTNYSFGATAFAKKSIPAIFRDFTTMHLIFFYSLARVLFCWVWYMPGLKHFAEAYTDMFSFALHHLTQYLDHTVFDGALAIMENDFHDACATMPVGNPLSLMVNYMGPNYAACFRDLEDAYTKPMMPNPSAAKKAKPDTLSWKMFNVKVIVMGLQTAPVRLMHIVSEWFAMKKFKYSFKGQTFNRPSDDYEIPTGVESNVAMFGPKATPASRYNAAAFGYGTSTWPKRNLPKKIIYAADELHVIDVVREAYEKGISLAVRTGGHQYGCFCSTTGENYQVDVRFAFDAEPSYDKTTDTCTLQVGSMLKDVGAWMRKLRRADGAIGAFVPHGECGTVHMGGHMQSGGYSPFCGRSFGYFVDHITAFKIILPPRGPGQQPEVRRVTKPLPGDDANSINSLLFKAVRGGCPGGFGVLVECEFKPLWDADYPYSRTKFWGAVYTPSNMKTFLNIVAQFNDKEDLPNDYNITVGTVAGNPLSCFNNNNSIDRKMSLEQPMVTGPRHPAIDRVIMVMATYANCAGAARTAEDAKQAEDFFNTIDAALGDTVGKALGMITPTMAVDAVVDSSLLPWLMPRMKLVNPPAHVPLSQGSEVTTFAERLQANPYAMSVYMSPNKNLTKGSGQDDFIQFSVDTCEAGQKVEGGWPDYQWCVMGGKMKEKQDNLVPFRQAEFLVFLYMHYDTVINGVDVTKPKEESHQIIDAMNERLLGTEENNHQDGFMKANWQMVAFPNGHSTIDDNYLKFFDSEESYKFCLKVKRLIDPLDIFTPNKMIVGSSKKFGTAPAGSLALKPVAELE